MAYMYGQYGYSPAPPTQERSVIPDREEKKRIRKLYNSVGMDAKDIAWYFENGYFANLTLDLNKKMIRKRMMPRSDLKRG